MLITSSNWLYLADFASFKPTYIPYDDPSDFSFFFDTGGRRLCYLAPEVCSFSFLSISFIFCFISYLNCLLVQDAFFAATELEVRSTTYVVKLLMSLGIFSYSLF